MAEEPAAPRSEPAPPPPQPAPAVGRSPASWRTGAARGRKARGVVSAAQWKVTALVAFIAALAGGALGMLTYLEGEPPTDFRTFVITEYYRPYYLPPLFAEKDRDLRGT